MILIWLWWSVKAGLWGQGKSRISSEIMGRVPGEESINKYPIISVNTRLFLAALAPHLNFKNLSLTSCDAILLVQDSSFLELWQRSKKWDFNKKAFHVVFAPYKEIGRLSQSVCGMYYRVLARNGKVLSRIFPFQVHEVGSLNIQSTCELNRTFLSEIRDQWSNSI